MANATDNLGLFPVGKHGRLHNFKVKAAKHVFEGALVSQLLADGMAVPYSTAASSRCVGVAQHEADNTAAGAADGDKEVQIETDREYAFANATAGDACDDSMILGSVVYGLDDHTIAKTSNAGARQAVGFFMGMEPDSGRVKVWVHPILAALVDTEKAADVGALVDNTTGVADNTLAAIPNPADAPATADALRDDIVANDLPAIRNNFADLAAQINAIRTSLRNAGLMA